MPEVSSNRTSSASPPTDHLLGALASTDSMGPAGAVATGPSRRLSSTIPQSAGE